MAEFIRSAIVYLRALFAALLSAALVGIFALSFAFPLGGVFRGDEGGSKKSGVYTLYSASSSGCFTDNPDFLQLLAVRGEAAVYEFSAENSASRAEILNAVSKKLNAEVRFTEEAGGAVSYYCYSDKIGAAREALEYYSESYGAYPYGTYSVVQTGFCYGGMEYPALSFLAAGLAEEEKIYATAHETAHQWWYALVGSNAVEEAWQDEGAAEYSAACFFGEYKQYGIDKETLIRSAEREYHAYYSVYSRVFHGTDTRMSRPLGDYAGDYEYRAIAYDKGLMLFSALEKSVGKKTVEKALRAYVKACAYKIAAPADPVAAFERSGVDVSGLFSSFLNGEAIV